MKHPATFLIIVLCLSLLAGCSQKGVKDKLIGKWEEVRQTYKLQGQADQVIELAPQQITVEYFADGTYVTHARPPDPITLRGRFAVQANHKLRLTVTEKSGSNTAETTVGDSGTDTLSLFADKMTLTEDCIDSSGKKNGVLEFAYVKISK